MNTSFIAVAVVAAFAASVAGVSAQSVIEPGATLTLLYDQLSFGEGPTCDTNGNVFFTDQNNNRIMEWTLDGKVSVWITNTGRSNWMYMDAKGNLIACSDEHNELWSISPDKKHTVLITNYDGKYLNGPNAVWVAPNGQMWITDPFYARSWWDHNTKALPSEQVFYLSADGKTLKQVTSDLTRPNGITGTPDGKTLYVSDIQANRTWKYDTQPDGTLTNMTLFCSKGSDGMTIDEAGNIYTCNNGGVTVFDKTGKQIDMIRVPGYTANLTFGGKDHKTLFITAQKNFYSIRCIYKGANPSK